MNDFASVSLTTDSLLAGLYILVAFCIVLAIVALKSAARARRRLREFEASLEALEQSMHSAANIFAESDMRINAACEQINQLAKRQGSLDAAAGQSGFKQAIALSRRGASIDELIDTCGISQGEARLISTLYGTTPGGAVN